VVDVPQELVDAKASVEESLLRRPGVVGVGIGPAEESGVLTDTLAVKIYVEPGHPVAAELPRSIGGFPVNVIERRFSALSSMDATGLSLPGTDTGTYDPLEGGISIGTSRQFGGQYFAGTLGAIVIDNNTGGPMLLSNFHVLCVDEEWSVGDQITQPSLGDASDGTVVGLLSRAALNNQVDCAVATQNDRDYAWDIVGVGAVNGMKPATLNLAVQKRGRTTGLTAGTVSAIALTVTINYGTDVGLRILYNQFEVMPAPSQNGPFSAPGDSGAVVFDPEDGAVVGLNFAGSIPPNSGIANPIAAVVSSLNITVPTSSEAPTWVAEKTLADQATGAPVLVTAEGRPLVMAFAGRDQYGTINIETSTNGTTFGNKVLLNQGTFSEPALALAASGSNLSDYIAWTGLDSNSSLNVASLGSNWTILASHVLPESSQNNPGLALLADGTLVLAWTGTDNRINVATSTDGGQTFPNKLITSQTSPLGPWISNIDGTLYLLWIGEGNQAPNIAQITVTPSLSVSDPIVVKNQQASYHPTLALAGTLILVFAGTDRRINVMLSNSATSFQTPPQPTIFTDTASSSPIACMFEGMLCLAWTGTDSNNTINIAELSMSDD
jgi:hypothetical protein